MIKQLRPYQQDIVNQTVKSDKSTLIQIPTGGGKTFIAKHIIMDLINHYNQQVLFVAPKIVLMEQTMEEFKGLRPQIIHGNRKFDKNHHLFISTIQTASRRELNPDVIIIDEIHYGFDGKMIEKLIKDKENVRIIGLSATPYDKNGRVLNGFNLILDKYDMKYMIKHIFLVPLKSYVLTRPNLKNVKVIAGDYDLKQLGEVVCDNNTILEIVQTTKEFINNSKKTIVFAVDIAHAELLSKAYEAEGFRTKALHSNLTKDEINKILNDFKNGYNNIKILVSVLMLTTGFDVPDTDCAVIARPTKSQNLYKQMVGRVLRTAPNKTNAILLDCGNVIENLGMPLEPIRIIEGYEIVNQLKCFKCGSINIKLTKIDDILYWQCQDCNNLEEVKQGSYECESCHQLHNYESNFITINNKLFLNCDCGYQTLISEYTGSEQLVEIVEKKDIDNQEYLPFEEAKKFVAILELETESEWYKYCNNEIEEFKEKPIYIPRNPNLFYIEWISWNDWLMTSRKKVQLMEEIGTIENDISVNNNIINMDSEYLLFEEAKKFVLNLKLDSIEEWILYIDNKIDYLPKKPSEIPNMPNIVYKDNGWISWDDWLFNYNEYIKNSKYLSFIEARKFVRSLNLKSIQEWKYYCDGLMTEHPSIPTNIPKNPKEIYKNKGWWGIYDWLGLKQSKQKRKQDLTKIKVYEIAKECGVTSSEMIQKAKELGIFLDSSQSEVFVKQAEDISNYLIMEK